MVIDTSKQYTATIETEKGDLVLELFASDVPVTVNNFVFLAHEGFYDGITFHRVIPGFMAQAGDPTGTGFGGCGYTIPDEFSEHTHVKGALSMANQGVPNTGGSQFFITYEARHDLDNKYSVFGQLIEGMDVLESLTPGDPVPNLGGDKIIRITISPSPEVSNGAWDSAVIILVVVPIVVLLVIALALLLIVRWRRNRAGRSKKKSKKKKTKRRR